MSLCDSKMKLQAEKKKDQKKPSTPMPPLKLERKTSIESEPKTLLREEINLAREAALKVMNTHTNEEALQIFLTGLVPIKSTRKANEDGAAGSECEEE
ncbi:hypothetical protein L6164_030400 [Bauhinia variegata]|uniref:Uncharacterized protein n=1 Tax=Bauhinia variegata TaxID=167791 RepID=A0ACB9LCL1_BAUVA|nr:hypothetical protein L6164_030400 [Bauhinia variegata]